jgi:hypothetical protein
MNQELAASSDKMASDVRRSGAAEAGVSGGGVFHVKCYDKDGNLKWEESNPNLVVNGGLADMNTKYFTGSSYTAAWYVGLYGSAGTNTPSGSDTMSSHAGWTEVTDYSQATRPACSFGSATTADPSVISNTGSLAAFTINATVVVGGAFLTSSNTKGGTTGVLFSASPFASPGDRNVVSGDTVTVQYTFSLDAA